MKNDKFAINLDDGNFSSPESFKLWNKEWERKNAYHLWVPESHSDDGSGCLFFRHTERSVNASYLGQKITLVKNARYKLSCYIKFENVTSTTANDNGGAYCVLGDSYIGRYLKLDEPFSSDGWEYFETFYTATYTGEYDFQCRMWGAFGTAWFDDIKITLVDEVDPEVLKHWPSIKPEIPENGFSLLAIGDPQGVVSDDVSKKTDRYMDSMKELVRLGKEWNLKYIMEMGDITDVSSDQAQWKLSVKAHDMLRKDNVPFSIALGNHDYDGLIGLRRGVIVPRSTKAYTDSYPYDIYEKWLGTDNFGSFDGTMLNTFHKFDYNGEKYMIIAVEYAPKAEVIDWAKKICDGNPEYHVIFTTHCLLHPRHNLRHQNEQADHLDDAVTADYMWSNLIVKCPNIFLTCCGHCDCHGTASLFTFGEAGNPIANIVVNPQGTLGGNEMMTALLNIVGTHVKCYAYSPTVCDFYAGSNFDIEIQRPYGFEGEKVILPTGFSGKMFTHTVFDGAVDRYEYEVSDSSVLSVDENGTVTAISEGESTFVCMIYTAQSEYAKKGPGARIRVEFKVKVIG